MTKNVSDRDSVIRMLGGLALLLIALGLMQWTLASLGVIVIGVLLLYTGVTRWCPLYALFRPDRSAKHPPASERHAAGR